MTAPTVYSLGHVHFVYSAMPFENTDIDNATMQYDQGNFSSMVIPSGNMADAEVQPEHTNWVNDTEQSEGLDKCVDETTSGPLDVVNIEQISGNLILGKVSTQTKEEEVVVDDAGSNESLEDSPVN